MKKSSLDSSQFYMAVIVGESSSSASDYISLYEESFVLITANSQEEANEKALNYAQEQQTSYPNEQGEIITWSLKQVVDVCPLLYDEFSDKTELYARHFRNYDAYRSFEPLLSGEEL